MADAASSKVTLLAALAAVLGPLAAEYSLILAAALMGGFIGLWLRADRLDGILRSLGHVLAGAGLAMIVTPAGALVALHLAPDSWALSVDVLLPIVAAAVAIWWRPALSDWLPGLVQKWLPKPPPPQ